MEWWTGGQVHHADQSSNYGRTVNPHGAVLSSDQGLVVFLTKLQRSGATGNSRHVGTPDGWSVFLAVERRHV